MTIRHSFRLRPHLPGFSLMEVTIAVAIIAVTCIPLIGMLPAGMKTMRDGQREAIAAEIVRHLTNELSMTSWEDSNELEDLDGTLRHFDSEGVPLEDETDATFTARIAVERETTLPGASAANPFLKQVTIRVTDKPAAMEERFTNPRFYRPYALLVAKMDK